MVKINWIRVTLIAILLFLFLFSILYYINVNFRLQIGDDCQVGNKIFKKFVKCYYVLYLKNRQME